MDNDGRVMDSKALRKRVFYGGVEPELRKEVILWIFTNFMSKIMLFPLKLNIAYEILQRVYIRWRA